MAEQRKKQTTAGLLEVYLDAGGRLWFREGFFERRYLAKAKENNNECRSSAVVQDKPKKY